MRPITCPSNQISTKRYEAESVVLRLIASCTVTHLHCLIAVTLPSASSSLRAALMVADRLIVPVPPASFEVWEVETIDELVGAAKVMNPKLDATSVLFMTDHRRGRNNNEAIAALRGAEHIGYSGVIIHSRVAWQEAQAAGRAVFEMPRPDAKALTEVNALTVAAFR